MIRINNITFSYRRKADDVLTNLGLSIEPGAIYGLLGLNGEGKSTLLHLMAGVLTPNAGNITIDDVDVRLRRPSTLSKLFIVPEEFSLPEISLENYVRINAPLYPNFNRDDMERYLKEFGLNSNINLKGLSMGQKKKVFISFALAANTPVMLMDEPTNGLDIPGKSTFRKVISMAASDDRTIIISTHQVRDIDKLLDHIIVMFNHKLLLNEPISEISRRLAFVESNDAELVEKALYCQSSVAGKSLVLPNDNDDDSEVNLETLFNLAIEKPEVITQLFNHKNA
ncbi:MAG: ABC transporter ATP-binding protein [Muribaculaceae bacterium]|nr:ABC transporter ATP-binding protein [Muribaculaceae bacterium]